MAIDKKAALKKMMKASGKGGPGVPGLQMSGSPGGAMTGGAPMPQPQAQLPNQGPQMGAAPNPQAAMAAFGQRQASAGAPISGPGMPSQMGAKPAHVNVPKGAINRLSQSMNQNQQLDNALEKTYAPGNLPNLKLGVGLGRSQ